MKSLVLPALLLAAAAPCFGATATEVKRGDLIIHVKVTGTVVAEDIFRLKSTIDGRLESVNTSSYTWRGSDEPLAMLAHKELAAMIDARGGQNQAIMEDRWDRVYRPTPVRCPSECYVLNVYAKVHTWVKPQSVLFEAARKLKMVGRVRPEDVPLIHDGQLLTFWAVKDPARKYTGQVARYVLDVQAVKEEPGATFTLYMSPERYFDPGTEWEGDIIPLKKSDVLLVPTGALITYDGATYLPIRVSTGITTSDFTQITAGAPERQPILVLDDASLHGTPRHAQSVDRQALQLKRQELDPNAAKTPENADKDKPEREKEPQTMNDNGYGGEDPYGEQ
jgi:hypothetical protein